MYSFYNFYWIIMEYQHAHRWQVFSWYKTPHISRCWIDQNTAVVCQSYRFASWHEMWPGPSSTCIASASFTGTWSQRTLSCKMLRIGYVLLLWHANMCFHIVFTGFWMLRVGYVLWVRHVLLWYPLSKSELFMPLSLFWWYHDISALSIVLTGFWTLRIG